MAYAVKVVFVRQNVHTNSALYNINLTSTITKHHLDTSREINRRYFFLVHKFKFFIMVVA